MKGSKQVFHFLVLTAASFLAVPYRKTPPPAPAVNLDAIHPVYCRETDETWQGTGFMIAPNVMATANHVIGTHCVDTATMHPLVPYKQDVRHDFALFTEDDIEYGPYIHYNCQRPKPGKIYISYGYSSMSLPDFFHPILRNNPMLATKTFDVAKDKITGSTSDALVREYDWAGVEGTSGGPVADAFGNVVAVNNAGNNKTSANYDLADTGLCTGRWDAQSIGTSEGSN